jgi:hypothetical protein
MRRLLKHLAGSNPRLQPPFYYPVLNLSYPDVLKAILYHEVEERLLVKLREPKPENDRR